MKIELIGEIAEYYGEQNPDLAPLPKNGIVLSATEDELQDVRFPKMQGELALVPSETACNAAKMREVVELLARVILPPQEEYPAEYGGGKFPDKDGWLAWIRQVQSYAKSALAAPARNCDVGTAEEQAQRFETFCSLHHLPNGKGCYSCPAIPGRSPHAFHRDACRANWNQMPYEEGGAK